MSADTPSNVTGRYFDSALEEKIYRSLLERGWQSSDILIGREVQSLAESQFIPDIVLLANLYPLATVEIKRLGTPLEDQRQTAEQLAVFAKSINLPVALLTDGEQILTVNPIDAAIVPREALPTKSELLLSIGADQWPETDPRLYPPHNEPARTPALHQALAVSRTLDSLLVGKNRVLITMPTGTGVTYVAFQLAWKLIRSQSVSRMLFVTSSRSDLEYARKYFREFADDVSIIGDQKRPKTSHARVNLATTAAISNATGALRNGFDPESFDLVIARDVHRMKPGVIEQFAKGMFIGFAPANRLVADFQQLFGEPVFSYTVREALAAAEVKPPEGYRAVKLGEIAEIVSGITINPSNEPSAASGSLYVLHGRDLLPDGNISFAQANYIDGRGLAHGIQARNEGRALLQPNDILISSVGARVAMVPAQLLGPTVFSSSLIRIRVDTTLASPDEVLQFLRSDVGQRAIDRIASSMSGVPRVTASLLKELQVFLSVIGESRTSKPEVEFSAVAEAIRQIKDEILPALEQAEAQSESIAVDDRSFDLVAGKLSRLARILVPPTLMEQVITAYPMPIALAYRRFYEARFNIYEQVLRLKDLFEAAAFFVYNTTLADCFRRLDGKQYFIEDSGARRAYNGYSMSGRMDFVEEILKTARTNNGRDLFLPELVQSSIVSLAKTLQDELRNRMSHTATATESQQRNVVREFQPRVEQMLSELDFLRGYQLVRVTSFYFSRSQLIRRMEVYHGTYTQIAEQPVLENALPTQADRDHVVMLDSDGQVLDLYPLYQILATSETRFETHMCFFKQRKQKDRRLEGESVQGSFAVELEGFDDFETLQPRILNARA
jgi:hypothetical protein